MARFARRGRYRKRLYGRKNKRYSFRKRYRKSGAFKKRASGMQKIKTYRYRAKNIGGDRAFAKLYYVRGDTMDISFVSGGPGTSYNFVNQCMSVGAAGTGQIYTLSGVMGGTPNLALMGATFTNYRIRGIKIKLTYFQENGPPVFMFTNAATSQSTAPVALSAGEPSPGFPTPKISQTPELRWCKHRVASLAGWGAKPTTLKAYYSVNKVYGPDLIVKGDTRFTGKMQILAPYFDTNMSNVPQESPWLQYGIATLNGNAVNEQNPVRGTMKIEQTAYVEFFGRRVIAA